MPSESIILVTRWILSGLLVVVAVTQAHTIAFSITILIAAGFLVPFSNAPELQIFDYSRFAVAVALIFIAYGFLR